MSAAAGTAEAEGAAAGGVVVATGLVDAGCAVTGYRETPLDDPGASARAIAELLLRDGVVGVRDLGSGLDALHRFRHASKDRVAVAGGGPVLVDGAVRGEGERPVRDAARLVCTLDALVAEEVSWVDVRAEDPAFLTDVATAARARGLRVAARGPTALDGAARGEVDVVQGLVALAGVRTGEGPVEALVRLSTTPVAVLEERLDRACGDGAAVATELVALRRTVFLKESLAAPHLDDLVPVLPHVRHLLQMRRGGGYLAGKRALARYSGLAQPSASTLREAERGWVRLLEATARAASAGVALLPASRAPQMAVVPGVGLREELALLVFAGLSATEVLDAASSVTPRRLGLAVEASPRLQLVADRAPQTPQDLLDLRVRTCSAA